MHNISSVAEAQTCQINLYVQLTTSKAVAESDGWEVEEFELRLNRAWSQKLEGLERKTLEFIIGLIIQFSHCLQGSLSFSSPLD